MQARQLFLERHAALHGAAMSGDGWWKATGIYAWVGPFWVSSAWTYATFLFWLTIEHNWFHLGETWVIRGMLTQLAR